MSIKVVGLNKSFDGKNVLCDFNAEFPLFKTSLIKGASGIGKTTLFRILSGLEKADSGTVIGTEDKIFSFMFQEDRLFSHITAKENVYTVCKDKNTAKIAMEICCCDSFDDKYPSELSGGMNRRVSLARALGYALEHKENAVLLLDEPFKGLDLTLTKTISENLIHTLSGMTVIIVMHEENPVFSGCNTVNI